MSAIVPSPAMHGALVSAVHAEPRRIDASTPSLAEDARGWARTGDPTDSWDAGRTRTKVQPAGAPEHDDPAGHSRRRTRPGAIPDYWPRATYFTQQLAQEVVPENKPAVEHSTGASRYPSLHLDSDLFLPGESIAYPQGRQTRVDIVV